MNHIRHTHVDLVGASWCGVKLTSLDWTFKDLDHAAYARLQEDTVQPCYECLCAAVAALEGPC